jgi:glycosyltransferase involved in cell wall biosynthesis
MTGRTRRFTGVKPTLSLCLIARNEERFLPACLESVRGVVDEIVLVDTGSDDSTVAIAEGAGAKVIHYPWQDDFAAARNQALRAATGRWMLVLDADERLAPDAGDEIRQALTLPGWEVGYLHFVNVTDDGSLSHEWTAPRLYRLSRGIRFIGRIHEQLVHPHFPVRTRVVEARVFHYGYQTAVYAARQKRARNTRLLEQALLDPEAQDPILRTNYLFHHANLATGAELVERYESLAAYIHETWPEGPPRVPWITGARAEFARLLNDVGRYPEARGLAQQLLDRHGESPMLRYLIARARAAAGDLAGAESELAKVLVPSPPIAEEHCQYIQDMPLVQSRARFLLGLIREREGRLEEALDLYQAATTEEPEQNGLRSHYACALVKLSRYQEALRVLEHSATMVNESQPGADCLALVLAVLTQSVSRLALWGDKVTRLAPGFPPAARLLERLATAGPQHQFRIEDFPEILNAIQLEPDPGRLRLPQTTRKNG